MFYYIIVLSISVLLSLIINKIYGFEKHKALKMFISLIPLTFISCFRYDVGWDYSNYVEGFNIIGFYGNHHYVETGFELFIKLLYRFSTNPQIFFVITSIIIALLFSLCYREYGKSKPVVYILLYFITRYYFCSLNIVRQAIAMLLILYSIKYLISKKNFIYILLVLLAYEIHKFAIIFLPISLFLCMDMKKKRNILFMILAIPLLFVFIEMYISHTHYSNYFDTMFGNDGTIVFSELIISAIIVFFSSLKYDSTPSGSLYRVFYNMELIVLILSIFSFMIPTVDRIIWYFSIQNIFFIPMIITKYKDKRSRLIVSSIMIFALLFVLLNQTILVGDSFSVLPYLSYFNN